MSKEAKARIKINKLLKDAGWRLLDLNGQPANVILENQVKISQKFIDELGDNFEKSTNGYSDFLLLDEKGYPFIVLEAKAELIKPLVGKEQARRYAKSQNCRYVILSNGNVHFFWDLSSGNPNLITHFPTQESLMGYKTFIPDETRLLNELIDIDYIALSQYPNFAADPEYRNEATRDQFFRRTKVRLLRQYQVNAIKSIQNAVSKGNNRFLFEMATGTGKVVVGSYSGLAKGAIQTLQAIHPTINVQQIFLKL